MGFSSIGTPAHGPAGPMEGKPVSRPGSGGHTLHARYSTLRQCSGAYLNLQSFRLADYTTQYLFLAFSPD